MRETELAWVGLQHPLLNHLWQSTAIVVLIWGLTLSLKRNPASIRYRLWMLASMKFLLPLSVLIEVGKALRPVAAYKSSAPILGVSNVLVRSVQPYAASLQTSLPTVGSRAPTIHLGSAVWIVCLLAWGSGALVMLALWLRTWLRLNGVARRGRPWREISGVPILMCEEAIDPELWNSEADLLLPEVLLRQLSEPELDAIYAHELCHARRLDNLTAALHSVVHAIFWFHPALWIIRAKLMDERERACDELVLASGLDTATYAGSILSVCKLGLETQGSLISGVTGGDLKDRIQRIVSGLPLEVLSPGRKLLLSTAASMVATVPVLLGLTNTRQLQAQSGITPDAPMSDSARPQYDAAVQAAEPMKFDVAAVRPSRLTDSSSNVPLGPGNVYTQSHGILRARNFPLLTYIVFAYKLTDYQQDAIESAAPNWILHDRYSIEARTEKADVSKDDLRSMMRSLLAERFRLAAHYEKKQVRVFALATVKAGVLGPQLRQHPEGRGCLGTPASSTTAEGKSVELPLQSQRGGFPTVCNGILGLPASAQDRYSFGASNVPMSLIASSLSSWGNVGRPVVDQTALLGNFDFVLDYTPDPRPSYATVDSGGPSFQDALKEQLGLKLQDRRAPVDFLVVDHIEHADAN